MSLLEQSPPPPLQPVHAISPWTRHGYFSDRSMIRQVVGERAVALSGPRALLMQAAHPLAVYGLLAHSGGLQDPYQRLARTAEVIDAITFGTREDADRMTAHVRAMHARARGRLPHDVGIFPKGTPYRADDPRLLMWILFTLVDSAMLLYTTYVGPLTTLQRRALWDDYQVVGELFGLRDDEMPSDLDALRAYGARMLGGDELCVGDWARRRAREIVLEPPVPTRMQPLLQTVNFVTIALLPDTIRRQYGFSPLVPGVARSLLVRSGAVAIRHGLMPLLPTTLRQVPSAQRAA